MSDLPLAALGKKTGYRVQLPVFEGPLDLLLHLIERAELDITRISLARVTDQYIEYMTALEELQVEDLSDFLVVAARLVLIKSQALLPRPPVTRPHEDESAGDDLVQQLRLYKQFKEAAKHLDERQKEGQRSYVRLAPQPYIKTGIEHLDPVSLETLLSTAQRVMKRLSSAPAGEELVTPFSLTVRDQINLISQTLAKHSRINFTDLLSSAYSRPEVAVTFMALLELIKQELIEARQDQMFGEIMITPST